MQPLLFTSFLLLVQQLVRNQTLALVTWQLRRFHSHVSLAHGCCEERWQAQAMPMCLVVHLVGYALEDLAVRHVLSVPRTSIVGSSTFFTFFTEQA
jgi:cytochrome oxidase assembly protein ShyY1